MPIRTRALLEQLPANLVRLAQLDQPLASQGRPQALELGWAEFDAILPDHGLPRGAVTELAVAGGAALGTSVALAAVRAAQQQMGTDVSWCAFVDPSCTLYGPGVAQAGVVLERLLVVRAPVESMGQIALRLARSKIFAVTVIDTVGVPGSGLRPIGLGSWARIVRQLSLGMQGSPCVTLLITDVLAARPLPLPVALRLELSRPAQGQLSVRVAKDRMGRISRACFVRWPPTPAEAPFLPLPSQPSASVTGLSSGESHARLFA
ncbi:MAG: recombinase A [Polyangiaceae bacterium]|nr:recombinase A [Polyangiaceae bacterium]